MTTTLQDLDEQSRERLIRAAEDSVRGELRRVNELLCEAIEQRDEYRREWESALERVEAAHHVPEREVLETAIDAQRERAVRAEAALTDALLKLNAAEHARDAYCIRAQAAERTAGMPATGRCVQCAAVAPMLSTSDGDMCGPCWTQRGAAAE